MRLDDEVRRVHDRYWESERQAAIGKNVVLVEGDDDRDVLEALLGTCSSSWRSRVRVITAGGYKKVLEKSPLFVHAHMLIDRDTRTDAEVASLRASEPFLHVTAGWCLENVFLDPDFVRTLDARCAERLVQGRERWIRAGALWWTLQRAREAGQRWWEPLWGSSFGMPRSDFDPTSAAEFRDSFPLAASAGVDVESLAHEFEARLSDVLAMSERDQWRVGVHGKAAFAKLLVPSLEHGGLPSRPAIRWRADLAERVGRPAPLDTLFAMLLA